MPPENETVVETEEAADQEQNLGGEQVEEAQAHRTRRIIREEIDRYSKTSAQSMTLMKRYNEIWDYTKDKFPEVRDTNGKLYAEANKIYNQVKFLKGFPEGQFYAALHADWMRRNELLRKEKKMAVRKALQGKEIISKAVHERSSNPPNKSNRVNLTNEQRNVARKMRMSDDEYAFYIGSKQSNDLFKK